MNVAWMRPDGSGIGVENLAPLRKSIALTLSEGNVSRVLAYFRSEQDAADFAEWMRATLRPGKDG